MPRATLPDEKKYQMAFRYFFFTARRLGLKPGCDKVVSVATTMASNNSWRGLGNYEEWLRFIDLVFDGGRDPKIWASRPTTTERALALCLALFENDVRLTRNGRFATRNLGNLAREIGVAPCQFADFVGEIKMRLPRF